jgi:dihydroxyacetone kinase
MILTSAKIRLAMAAGVALVVLVLAGGWYVSSLRNTDLQHQLAAAKDRADSLGAKVIQADQAVTEAKAINARMTQAMTAMSAANAAANAQNAQLERDAAAAMKKVATAAAAARAEDVKRRARPDLPPPEEMTAVLREVLGAM